MTFWREFRPPPALSRERERSEITPNPTGSARECFCHEEHKEFEEGDSAMRRYCTLSEWFWYWVHRITVYLCRTT